MVSVSCGQEAQNSKLIYMTRHLSASRRVWFWKICNLLSPSRSTAPTVLQGGLYDLEIGCANKLYTIKKKILLDFGTELVRIFHSDKFNSTTNSGTYERCLYFCSKFWNIGGAWAPVTLPYIGPFHSPSCFTFCIHEISLRVFYCSIHLLGNLQALNPKRFYNISYIKQNWTITIFSRSDSSAVRKDLPGPKREELVSTRKGRGHGPFHRLK